MILVGELSLWVALLMAAWSALASFAGAAGRRDELADSGARAAHATFGFVLLASLGLCSALLASDFSLNAVASHTSANLPGLYKLAAFWGGASGSLLLWTLLLSCFGVILLVTGRGAIRAITPWATGTVGAVLVFLLLTMVVGANPYRPVAVIPQDGRGLLAELQHFAMVLHPPLVCSGYAATTIPFALVIGALAERRFDEGWLRAVRAWSLVAWVFLSAGIALGMWWAYNTLGWGGVWAWERAQSAALVPWLANTALLHGLLVEERRGTLRAWNSALAAGTFLLALFGAFILRRGGMPGIHGYAQGTTGNAFGVFLLVAAAASTWLFVARRADLRSIGRGEPLVSRVGALVGANAAFIAIAVVVTAASLVPSPGAAIGGAAGQRSGMFNAIVIPLGLLSLGLAGVGPLLPWRHVPARRLPRLMALPASGGLSAALAAVMSGVRDPRATACCALAGVVAASVAQQAWRGVRARRLVHGEPAVVAVVRLVTRHPRRTGGALAHAGLALLCAGLAGNAIATRHDVTLAAAQAFSAADPWGEEWSFMSLGVSNDEQRNRLVRFVALNVTRGGTAMGFVRSEKQQFLNSMGEITSAPMTVPGVVHTWRGDVYIVFTRELPEGGATMRITFMPLVPWVWIGALLMVAGGLISMRRDRKVDA